VLGKSIGSAYRINVEFNLATEFNHSQSECLKSLSVMGARVEEFSISATEKCPLRGFPLPHNAAVHWNFHNYAELAGSC